MSLACKQPPGSGPAPAPAAAAPPAPGAAAPGAAAPSAAAPSAAAPGEPGPPAPPSQDAALIGSRHDTLSAAREGLEAALKLPVELPLPFPRVERHADEFRVVLGRGKTSALTALQTALRAAGYAAVVTPAGQAGGDDVIRLGIICTDGTPTSVYQPPVQKGGVPRELARLQPGQVVVPKEEDDEPAEDGEGAHGGSSREAVTGYLTILQPRAGLLPSPTVLLPADCTPRDEDNDDGNGRLLQGGRLCLTTRFSGKKGQVPHADLLAVSPNYRRCVRFPDAGTFDGFDHDAARTQFAVEAALPTKAATPEAAPGEAPGGPKAARPQPLSGLHVYAVSPRGELTLRGQLPGLQRPAYLGANLVAVVEPQPGSGPAAVAGTPPGLVVLADAAKLVAAPGDSALPAPRRIFSFAPGAFLPLAAKVAVYRPAAPTLHDGRVHASFQQGCRPDGDKRVRAAAKASYVQCVLEVDVEVGLDGSRPQQRCRLDNLQNNLEEPIPTPCPT